MSYGTPIPGGGEGSTHCGRGSDKANFGVFLGSGPGVAISSLDHLECFVLEFVIHDLGERKTTLPCWE